MKTRYLVSTLIIAAVIGAVGYGAYRTGMNHRMQTSDGATATATQSTTGAQKPGDIDPATGKKFDKPGKSPFMDMACAVAPTARQEVGRDSPACSRTWRAHHEVKQGA
jgi:hypothetical protein